MDLVANYDSEDELDSKPMEVENEIGMTQNKPKIVALDSKLNQESKVKPKKKKKLDLSFLPNEIQIALLRGDSLKDSDDEFDKLYTNQVNDLPNGNLKSKETSTKAQLSNPLLGLLPPPKKYKVKDIQKNSNNIEFDSDEDNAGIVNVSTPSLSNCAKPGVRSVKFESNETISNEKILPPKLDKPTQDFNTTFSRTPQLNEANHPRTSYEPLPSYQVDHGNRKRKERNIEIELLNGNVSILNELSENATHVNAEEHLWDVDRYREQQEREATIQKEFNFKSHMMPTKNQNRKHQVNSLVFKAAQTELAMMDAKMARAKTKRETQGKYGW